MIKKIIDSLFSSPQPQTPKSVEITLDDLITSSGKYPERALSKELTEELLNNGRAFLIKVNAMLHDLGITEIKVSSGFRPSEVNSSIGGAKKSLHMTLQAVDFEDKTGSIDKAVSDHPELLKKHGLWLEHPDSTSGWSHWDCSTTRKDREIRIFRP